MPKLKQFNDKEFKINVAGKNIIFASDDPVGAVQLSGLNDVKNRVDQFLENSNLALDRLKLMDSTFLPITITFFPFAFNLPFEKSSTLSFKLVLLLAIKKSNAGTTLL